ncbi:MAG: hypothetical protein IKE01_06985 [Clostridia bacterium]|nr:hypothetical protein [Clostridia bacterium]
MQYTTITIQHGKEELIIKNTQEPVTETRCSNNCSECNNKQVTDEEIIERVKKLGAEH